MANAIDDLFAELLSKGEELREASNKLSARLVTVDTEINDHEERAINLRKEREEIEQRLAQFAETKAWVNPFFKSKSSTDL